VISSINITKGRKKSVLPATQSIFMSRSIVVWKWESICVCASRRVLESSARWREASRYSEFAFRQTCFKTKADPILAPALPRAVLIRSGSIYTRCEAWLRFKERPRHTYYEKSCNWYVSAYLFFPEDFLTNKVEFKSCFGNRCNCRFGRDWTHCESWKIFCNFLRSEYGKALYLFLS